MEEIISKEELEELKRMEGEIRGIGLKEVAQFIKEREGKKGGGKVRENNVAARGLPI